MRTCPNCGRQSPDDLDFCPCGNYLRWEPTGAMPAVDPHMVRPAPAPPAPTPPPPQPAAAPPSPPPNAAPAAVAPVPELPPRPPAAAVPDGFRRDGVLATVTLRVPGTDGTPGQTVAVPCEPGGRARLLALVRNGSEIVDNYGLELAGLPAEWYTVAPNPIYLVPYGSAGNYEQDVEIELHPPRSPEAEARVWNVEVVAHSSAYGRPAARAPLTVGIQPYEEIAPKLKPEVAAGRRRARYEVAVRNKANAPVRVALGLSDPEGALRAELPRREVVVPTGQSTTTKFSVRPPRQIWIGRPVEHRFDMLVKTGEEADLLLHGDGAGLDDEDGGGPGLAQRAGKLGLKGPSLKVGPGGVKVQQPKPRAPKPKIPNKSFGLQDLKMPGGGGAAAPPLPLLPTQGVFRQKPWVPRWLALLLLLLIIAGVLLYLLFPRNVAVPNVIGKKVTEANGAIATAGLAFNPVAEGRPSDKPPGTVIAQSPEAGDRVKKSVVVSLVTAVGSGDRRVPDVAGKEYAEAATLIGAEELEVGGVPPDDPKTKVASTAPPANTVVKEGKVVQVFLVQPKPQKPGGKPEEGKPGEDGTPAAKPVALPAAGGLAAAALAAKLTEAGLAPEVTKVFSDEVKAGDVISTDPPAGEQVEPGGKVKILVSLGIPQIAFDTDENIAVVDGFDGKPQPPLAKGPERDLGPAFNSAGTKLAFVSGDQLQLADLTKPDAVPRAITNDANRWRAPAFAPTPDAQVLAALKLGPEVPGQLTTGDVCIGPVQSGRYQPECIHKDGVSFLRVVRWAPSGRALFAFAARDDGFGIYRFRSSKPFSGDRDDYGNGRLVTDIPEPSKGVLDLSISPDGKQMAVIANFETREFQLYLGKPGDFGLAKAKLLPVQACKVAWRPDSAEVAIVQADDCGVGFGDLARVEIADPRRPFTLAAKGDSPTYRPPAPDTGSSG